MSWSILLGEPPGSGGRTQVLRSSRLAKWQCSHRSHGRQKSRGKTTEIGGGSHRRVGLRTSQDLGRAVPKDASFHPTSYIMATDVDSLAINYATGWLGRPVRSFNIEVLTEDINVADTSKKLALDNVTITPLHSGPRPGPRTTERTLSGGMVVPTFLKDPAWLPGPFCRPNPSHLSRRTG